MFNIKLAHIHRNVCRPNALINVDYYYCNNDQIFQMFDILCLAAYMLIPDYDILTSNPYSYITIEHYIFS